MEQCDACGYNPSGDELSETKSIYLSTLRYEFEDEKEKYKKELKQFAQRLNDGEEIEYAKEELERLGELRAAFLSVTGWHLVLWFLRAFWPAFALLGGMYLIYRVLEWLSHSR